MNNKNDDMTINVTGWLHTILEQGAVTLASNEAERVIAAKQWLARVNSSELMVVEVAPPELKEVTDADETSERGL